MSRRSEKSSPARWPFWLLIVAWVCANSPQAATYAFLTWVIEAHHFNHQQRLTLEVARVLTGDRAAAALVAGKDLSARPFTPLVPAEATLKKIELAVERTAGVLPPAVRKQVRVARAIQWPEARRVAPPHEPPRLVG